MIKSFPPAPIQSGFYMGDSPVIARPTIPKGKRVNEPLVISAVDLKKLTQKLDGSEADERLRQTLNQDREDRFKLSKSRVGNWNNTFAGQRRKRLQTRIERLDAEEAARVEADRQFRAEEVTRREAAVERAKQLQYLETDLVKAFHSRVMLLQVLEERDLQVQTKLSRKDAVSTLDEKYHKETIERLEAAREAETKSAKEAKLRRIQLAKDQLQQQREHLQRKMTDRKVALEEGQRLAQADREYKQSQKELEKKRRENTIVFSKQLQDLRDQTKERKIKRKEEDAVEAENIEAWVNRKANQTEMKKTLETKWFNDGLNVRQQLGENQLKISSDADAKIEEQIKQRMLERDIKSKKEEQEKLERKKKNHEELRQFFQDYLRQVKERKQRQKEEDQKTLQEYMRVRDNTNAQREAQRQANLQEGKALQAFHKKQMEHNSNMRAKDKTERLVDAMARKEVAEAEEQALYEYMKQVGQEPWAVKNNRLQRFIGEELAARTRPRSASSQSSTGSSNGSQYGGNGRYVSTAGLSPASAGAAAAAANKKRAHQTHTSQRMGFTNDGWASMSRTNEIAAGNQLALIGEGLH